MIYTTILILSATIAYSIYNCLKMVKSINKLVYSCIVGRHYYYFFED